eukprot:227925_1
MGNRAATNKSNERQFFYNTTDTTKSKFDLNKEVLIILNSKFKELSEVIVSFLKIPPKIYAISNNKNIVAFDIKSENVEDYETIIVNDSSDASDIFVDFDIDGFGNFFVGNWNGKILKYIFDENGQKYIKDEKWKFDSPYEKWKDVKKEETYSNIRMMLRVIGNYIYIWSYGETNKIFIYNLNGKYLKQTTMKNVIQSQAMIIPSNFINNQKFRKSVLSKYKTGKYCNGFDCIVNNNSNWKSYIYFSECGGKIAVERQDKELIIYDENGEKIITMLHPRGAAIIQCLAVTENGVYYQYSEGNWNVWCWKQGTDKIVQGWHRDDMSCLHTYMRYF